MTPHAPQTPRDTERRTAAPDGRPLDAQPKWRRDFPIDWPQDEYVGRRDLVKFIVLTSVAFVVGQGYIVAKSLGRRSRPAPAGVAVARVDELAVGEAKTFRYPEGSTPRLLVRTGAASSPLARSMVMPGCVGWARVCSAESQPPCGCR